MENQIKTALITGATSGIGYELAKLFAQDQYNLIIVARNTDELEHKANEFRQSGVQVTTIAKDLFNKDEVNTLCQEVEALGVQVDVLVNNAGQGLYGEFKDTDIEGELAIINLNINSLVMLTKHFVKQMVQRNDGKILNLASVASKLPGPWQSVYHGTKAFVLSFTEAIRAELAETNITITALMPGATDTDFFNKADMLSSKVVQDKESLDKAADVAKVGYDALMNGDDKVIAGFKNKVQVGMSNLMPDSVVANNMREMQKPAEQEQQQNE
ncbi:SDR family NAD(P)-dependent oxidoreductase [Mucilaginibacter myungsuensis]|uniref:SDR family oxidoreductase n=1 Tax=Mucilaginibacter myungsuensis TaxID=649104 RepID=A0A929KYB8_9SPHI|nr:SDR family oxidoreductase [Mucilaginibacter myungsuensis]MBE9663926.1 SDR family oxidoreductase [Mucilaginibacter myungsuensis]MDN3598358.1 SDR family oxidoreductase [Mucilaginibacter myungsuensis]